MADERMARGRQRAGERTHGRVLAVMGVVTAVVVVVAVAVGVAFSGVFGALTSQHAGATATGGARMLAGHGDRERSH